MEGPICRYSDTADQLWEGKKVTYESLTSGLKRILYGLMKKMVIADRLNPFVMNIFTYYSEVDGGVNVNVLYSSLFTSNSIFLLTSGWLIPY